MSIKITFNKVTGTAVISRPGRATFHVGTIPYSPSLRDPYTQRLDDYAEELAEYDAAWEEEAGARALDALEQGEWYRQIST